jgi:hypothetical protein
MHTAASKQHISTYLSLCRGTIMHFRSCEGIYWSMHCMTKDVDGADMMDDGSIRLHA